VNTVPIAGKLLQLRCATCNKTATAEDVTLAESFVFEHSHHSGYSVLVEVREPKFLAGRRVDIAV
jgi:hypothetical protein